MPINLPDLGMSALEKQKIRNRSNVVARHVNPAQDQKPFVEAQVWRIAGDDTNLIHFQSLCSWVLSSKAFRLITKGGCSDRETWVCCVGL